jgi:NACHT domain
VVKKKPRPPAEGERTALSGFVPQYLVAAEKVLQQLNAGTLKAVIIGDPEAGRLDDFQLIREHEGSLRLDAYQVKWGDPARALNDSEVRGLLVDAVKGLGKIRAAQEGRRAADQPPIERFVAHIYSNRAPSQAGLRGEFAGRNLSVAAFLDELWPAAAAGKFDSVDDVPERWRSYLEALGRRCGEEPATLLSLAREIHFDLRQELPEGKIPSDRAGMRFRGDVAEMAPAMKRLVIESTGALTLDTEEFLAALNWSERGSQRSIHQFPLPSNLKQIGRSIERLQNALDCHRQGYVFLFGSPGSGKSTLLTHALRLDPRIAARYYAFVPDHDSRTRGEAPAFLHDLLLALRGRGTLLPPESDITLLREELHRELVELGRRALDEGRTALLLIDGLDHVLRDPKPRDDLLNELPAPEQVPEGVVIVIGTRRREDLPATVAALASDERVIEMEPLSRAAVLELASEAGVGESGEAIFGLSEGHPLLTQTFIDLVAPLPEKARGATLDSIEPLQGEVMLYYERIWGELGEDDDLIDALEVISRLRVPIDFPWLEETGTPRAAIRRLEKLRHLFRELSSGRWVFFHDSFREFLRRRTGERGGKADPQRDQQIHGELAERCLASEPSRPEAWESIHHLIAAGRPDEALAHATPSFYRGQYEALRPVPDIKDAIREAVAGLHDCNRSDAVLNLALSAADAQGREYSYPEGGELAQVLVGLGEPDLAMAHVEHVDDHVVDRDRALSAMKLVIALLKHGYEPDAERFFDLHEPLQWLGGGGERRGASRGPWEALRAWARAAILVRGAAHVVAGVRLLSIDDKDVPWPAEDFEEQLRRFRVELLAAAAVQALRWERDQDYAELLAAIDPGEPGAPDEIAECLLFELAWADEDGERREVAERLNTTVGELSPALRLRVARALFRFDGGAEAARQIETVPEPELPERSSGRDGDHEWRYLYSYYRLRAALGHRDSPTEAVPIPAQGRDTEVLVARHLIRQAALHGRLVAGEVLAPGELVRVVRSFHAFRDGLLKEDRFGDYGIGELRTTLAHTAIVIAGEIGPAAVDHLWRYWEERWRNHEPEFLGQGIKLLGSFHEAGLSETIVRGQLAKLEEAFESRADFEADDLVSLARAWLGLEEPGRARKCLASAISHTGGVGFRKDHQLIEWVRLIEPLLLGPDAAPVARWLTEALISLNERVEATAPWEAARLMLRILAGADPELAVACGETLIEARILDLDETLLKVLEGTATRATQLWWEMVGEILVAVGSAPPREALAIAVSVSEGPEVAAADLRALCERVAIEGRPTQRLPWRAEILAASAELGLSAEDLGLIAEDFVLGDETPSRSSYSGDSPQDERADHPLAVLVADLKDDPSDHSSLRAILRRAEELSDEQLVEIDSLLTGTDEESRFAAALAKRALAAGDTAEAWDQAERCLRRAASGDWQRHWAGGPVLDAVPVMLAIDAERGRRLTFERFATVASQDRYLLSEVGRSLEDYLEVLGPFEPLELSEAIWSYLTNLLARDAPRGAPAIARPLRNEAPEFDQAKVNEALGRVISLLLSSPYTLARGSGQRALSAALRLGGAEELLASLVEDPALDPALLLAVLEAHVEEGGSLEEGVITVARSLAVAERLDLRAAARGLLARIGEKAPETAARPLPGTYELEVHTPVNREGEGDVLVGSGDLEEMVSLHRVELSRLAELAEVDVDLLHERIITLARGDGGREGKDRLRGDGPFGWGYLRPSVWRVHHALARICGELFDARRVNPFDALRAARLIPLYDSYMLACRPERRPATIAPILGHEQREPYYSDWFLGKEPGPERFAKAVEDWVVIGESSHLALLAREYPEETRESALVLGEGEMFRSLSMPNAKDQRLFTPRFEGELIIQRLRPQLVSPHWWLALNGTAAAEAGLVRDPSDPFSWRCEVSEEVVVRSLWWQSGYLRWAANSETDEVGEGWLVIAHPAVVERLTVAVGPLRLHWRIRASMRKESAEEPEVKTYEGKIADW